MKRVGEGIELSQSGDREAARHLFTELWDEIGGERGDPFHRCALAHWMADVQDDVHDELLWDRRALAAADLVSDERAAAAGVTSPVAGFYPSLHLNVAECYRKLGDYDQARHHLAAGWAAVDVLPDDGYGRMISGGLQRLAERLAEHAEPAEGLERRPS
ncbi:MAG TPA: hypothetical protein VFX74_00025 [Candidatus Limnocylindria bacterium]|nr:hypothetical protein [Candidatus Limnocylindria bacterium]